MKKLSLSLVVVMATLSSSFASAYTFDTLKSDLGRSTGTASTTNDFALQSVNVPCTAKAQCGEHGSCTTDGFCKCDAGYLTDDASAPCGYSQSSAAITMFLSIPGIFHTGAPYYYVGRTLEGALITSSTVLFFGLLGYVKHHERQTQQASAASWYNPFGWGAAASAPAPTTKLACLVCTLGVPAIGGFLASTVWSVVDLFRIPFGNPTDVKGHPLTR